MPIAENPEPSSGSQEVIEQLREVFNGIVRNDKTPNYGYSEARPDGKRPARGSRWKSPREMAQEGFGLLDRLPNPEQEEGR